MVQMRLHFIFIFICIFISVTLGLEHERGVRRVYVREGDDAVLPCSPNTNINLEPRLFDWRKFGPPKEEVFMYLAGLHYNNGRPGQSEKFKGRVSHFKDQLKYGNASIKITDVRLTDGGIYTCILPYLQPRQTYQVELSVGAKPVISTLEETQDWSLLKCEVRGASPEPKLEWQDSAGNILHAEEPNVTERRSSFDIIRQIIVKKTDLYRCVLTQEDIGHQTASEIFVRVNEGASAKEDSGLLLVRIIGMIIGAAVFAAVFAAVLFMHRHKKIITLSRNKPSGQKPDCDQAENGEYRRLSENGDVCLSARNVSPVKRLCVSIKHKKSEK